MIWALFYIIIFVFSALITEFLRLYTIKASILDIPNHRSSHQVPTPKTGGLAFIFSSLSVAFILFFLKILDLTSFEILVVGGGIIALIGLLGDYSSVSPLWRLIGQFLVCSLSLYSLDGVPALYFFHWLVPLTIFTNIFGVLYLMWLVNLYNFMDGIDGLAAVELITACVGASILYAMNGYNQALLFPLALALAVLGFFLKNFPKAKIFMGDTGSSFLGFVLGILSLQAALLNPNYFWSWLIFLAVFIIDASLTLFNRLISKENIYEAHCTHAYQNASRYYGSHKSVTLRVLFINIFWLTPCALLVGNNIISGCAGLTLAYLPLIFIARKFNAGKKNGLNILLSKIG